MSVPPTIFNSCEVFNPEEEARRHSLHNDIIDALPNKQEEL